MKTNDKAIQFAIWLAVNDYVYDKITHYAQ